MTNDHNENDILKQSSISSSIWSSKFKYHWSEVSALATYRIVFTAN